MIENDQPEHATGRDRKTEVLMRKLIQARNEALNRFIQINLLAQFRGLFVQGRSILLVAGQVA